MTKFETYLIENGYLMFAFDCKEMKYYKPKSHIISTMVNLGHIYIPKTDVNLLNQIEQGKSVMDEDWKDSRNKIAFGLHEKNKPPTLISPRPRIEAKTEKGWINEEFDDTMNICLSKEQPEKILEAMYNKDVVFKYEQL